jgi:hypothetical protein
MIGQVKEGDGAYVSYTVMGYANSDMQQVIGRSFVQNLGKHCSSNLVPLYHAVLIIFCADPCCIKI